MGKDQEFLEAARNGNITLFEKILIQKSKRGGPLASLRRGPGINVQDSVGYSALHYSALNGHTDIVRLLLFHDASPNLLDSRGSSALHLAAWAGHQEIVKMLLTHPYKPANPDMQTMENETPLHCAAQHGHTGALTTLLAHGADPNVRNNRNETPLDLAAQYGRLQAVQMLIRAHPELLQPYSIETDSTSSSVSSGGAAAAAVVNHSALHLASRNGHNNVVEILLAAGVNVNLLTPSGTALHEAALCGKDVVVRTLLEHGADLNATDSENRTPLDVLQEFPPHVTKSIISVINSFRSHENEDLYDRYASEETDEPSSTMGKENKLGFQNHSDSISASVLTQSFEQSNLSEHQAQASSNGELADFYVKMEPIKIQKAAPKKPPRRNLSISPTHLQNFFLNNELIRHNMEICGNNTAAENQALQISSENSLQNQASYGYICTGSSGSAIYSSEENLINSNNPTTGRNSSWYSHSEDMEKAPTTDFKPVPAPRKLKNSFQSFDNATLKSYNPNRRLKRNREHYFAKGQFSLAISTSCGKQQHLPENLRTSNPTPGKNEKITSRRPLSQEHKFPPDYLHLEEAGISPQDNHPLSLCNSSGSISSGVSLSDRSLSTDCVEEYVGDEPFAGLFKGSTMNLSKVCSNKTKGFYSSNNEYHSKSSVIRSRRDLEDIYKHAASSTTDSQSESSDEASITIMNDKVNIRSRIKRDKRLGSDRRNKFKESQNIRKIRPFSSCENNTPKMPSSTSAAMMKNADWKNDCSSSSGTPPTSSSAAMVNASKSISVKNDQSSPSVDVNKPTNMAASCRPSKILSSYNEQEAWDKLSQIMETFGNSTLNGLNSFWDPDDINQSREYDKLAKLLDKNGLRHLERSLYNSGYDNFRFLNGIIDEKDLPGMNISGEDGQKLMTFVKTLPYANFMTLAVDATLDQWLKSIQLIEYSENFKKHLYNTLKSVCGVWEIELQTVLEINKIGHRKRILHSVAQIRQAGDVVKSSCDNITNKNSTSKENNPKGTLGHPKKNRPAPKPPIKTLEIRAPSELLIGLPHNLHIKWPHSTCSLISNSLKYEVCYLGSTVVKELRGTETTRKSIQKLKRVGEMTNQNGSSEKQSSIVQLSISYRGVEFIDLLKSETICEHEIRNINCACQDADDMRHFAYITKDNGLNLHYCHVFNVDNMHLAMEIILTLAESFEVAYQMALRNTPIYKSTEHLLNTIN